MWLQVRQSLRVLGIQFTTKAWGETWGLNLNLWCPLHPMGKNIFSLVLPLHLCSWHSGRPHLKQTKLVKLIIMPFFVVVDLSAEESTDHISGTCLLKVSQNAGKSVLYCIQGIVWQQPQEFTFRAYMSLVYLRGLSHGSSGFSVFVLLSYLKLSYRELGEGNKQQETLRTWWFKEKESPAVYLLLLESLVYLPVPSALCTLSAPGPRPPHTSWPLFSFPPVRALTCFSSTSFLLPAEGTEGSLNIAILFLS